MFRFIRSYFLRISIARKLLLGYGVLLFLLVVISAYSLINLNWINAVNTSNLTSDLPVINASEKLIDLLLEQEFYAQRYQILRKLENLEYYREREAEFIAIAEQIGSLTDQRELLIDRIVQLHIQYGEILSKPFSRSSWQATRTAEEYEEKIKLHQEKIIALIRAMAADAISDQKRKTKVTTSIGDLAFNISAAYVSSDSSSR